MSEWTSVKDKLPELESANCSIDCIVTNGDYVTVAYRYFGTLNEDNENLWFERIHRENISDVSYWIPLPSPPEEQA